MADAITIFTTKLGRSRQLNICQKCGWPWFNQKQGQSPTQCPGCHNTDWQQPYQYQGKKAREPQGGNA